MRNARDIALIARIACVANDAPEFFGFFGWDGVGAKARMTPSPGMTGRPGLAFFLLALLAVMARFWYAVGMKKFSDMLREAIDDSGLSRYAISRETRIAESVLSRFVRGERGLSLESIDELVAFLDLEVRPRRKRKGN